MRPPGDANRQSSELKFKLIKSEQEVTSLEQNVSPPPPCQTDAMHVAGCNGATSCLMVR